MEKIRNYFVKEIDQNDLMSNKNKEVFATLKLHWTLFSFSFCSSRCISTSALASLVDISTGSMISTKKLNICAIIARINSINQ